MNEERENVLLRDAKKKGEKKKEGSGALFSTWESIVSHAAAPPGLSPVCKGG